MASFRSSWIWTALRSDPLDLIDEALMAARERGVRIVISMTCSAADLRHMEFGVYQARRAGLDTRDVANTRTLA